MTSSQCFIVVIALMVFSLAACQTDLNFIESNEKEYTISNYNCKSAVYQIQIPSIRKLLIKVKDLKSSGGSYLLIQKGPTITANGDYVLFTNVVKITYSIGISSNETFIHYVYRSNNEEREEECQEGFEISYMKDGIGSITKQPMTTTSMPTLSQRDDIYFRANIIYVARDNIGNEPIDRIVIKPRFVRNFKTLVSEMAKSYCEENLIELEENISEETVHINAISRCPILWRNSNECVSVMFSVPITQKNINAPYRLSQGELKIMWQRYNSLLEKFGIEEYKPHHASSQYFILIELMLAIISIVAVITVISRCVLQEDEEQMRK